MKRITTLVVIMVFAVSAVFMATVSANNTASHVGMAATASAPTVSAEYDKKTDNVTIIVNDNGQKTTAVVKYEKNATKEYTVGAYTVKIEYNGSGVKSAKIVSAPVVNPGAANNGNSGGLIPNKYDGEIRDQYNNANFHCNAFSGNGRVWTTYGKEVTQKLQDTLYFKNTDLRAPQSANKDTTWLLDNKQLKRIFTCEECGSTQWISYSNNSGVPDGKNIQITHPGEDITVVKKWIMNNDRSHYEIEKVDKYGEVTYTMPTFTAKFEFAYKLNGVSVKDSFSLSTSTMNGSASKKYFVPTDVAASLTETSFNETSANLGFSIVSGYPVKEGTRWTFVNEDDREALASLTFEKRVEGTNIVKWLEEKEYDLDILKGLEFFLSGENGNYGPVTPNGDGNVVFNNIVPGTYTLSEEITGAAVGIFKKMADIEIALADGENKVVVLGGTLKGNIAGPDIQADDLFTIVNGYGTGAILNYPGLNNNGDLFYIGVTNTRTRVVFDSFCAYGNAQWFAGDGGGSGVGYMVAMSIEDRAYLQAFNYIVDNYYSDGDFANHASSARRIAQTVVWALLNQIDITSEAWNDVYLTAEEKAAVEDTLANFADYVGNGSVIDVIYMVGVDKDGNQLPKEDYRNAQPQIVPIFGTFYVENELEETIDAGISFTKVKFGGLLEVLEGEFAFDLFKKDAEGNYIIKIGTYYTDASGKVTAEGLEPGSYKFVEVLATYAIPEADYKFIWKADDLFFEINAEGKVVWAVADEDLDDNGNPTVNNTFWNKSIMQWVKDIQTGAGTMGDELDGGYIFFPGGAGSDTVLYEVSYPTCMQGGVIWFFYSDEDGNKGQPLMSIYFAEATGHIWELSEDGSGLVCNDSGHYPIYFGWWDLSADLYEIYQELGGLGAW